MVGGARFRGERGQLHSRGAYEVKAGEVQREVTYQVVVQPLSATTVLPHIVLAP